MRHCATCRHTHSQCQLWQCFVLAYHAATVPFRHSIAILGWALSPQTVVAFIPSGSRGEIPVYGCHLPISFANLYLSPLTLSLYLSVPIISCLLETRSPVTHILESCDSDFVMILSAPYTTTNLYTYTLYPHTHTLTSFIIMIIIKAGWVYTQLFMENK
jgi:hypothetical protein